MSNAVDSEQLNDDDLVELELEQRQLDLDRELKQRQLDLDRKKIEIRKRRAKLQVAVDLTLDDNQTQVKGEPTDNVQATNPLDPRKNPLPSPARTEATETSTMKRMNAAQARMATPVKQQHLGERPSEGPGHCPINPTHSPIIQPEKSSINEQGQFSSAFIVSSRTAPAIYRPVSQAALPATPALQPTRQQHGFGLQPANASLKRSHSPNGLFLSKDYPTIEAKRPKLSPKLSTNDSDQTQGRENKERTMTHSMSGRQRSEIIRKYGHLLVECHMQSFRRHDRVEADMVIKAGSNIVDGLLKRKFTNLEELHKEYEGYIGLFCTGSLRENVIAELQKFRRAAPIWWGECEKKKHQEQRLELVKKVFQEVKKCIYDPECAVKANES